MRKTFLTFCGRGLPLAALSAALLTPTWQTAAAQEPLLDVAGVNITDVLGNVHGGVRQGIRVMDKADLTAAYLGDNHGQPGLSFFVDGQVTDATGFSEDLVGAKQAISNIDGPAGVRLVSAWVAKDFGGKASVKAGVIDLNTEFDVQPTGLLFLNAAFGIGPDFSQAGANGPSIFPSTGLGLVGSWLPGGHWQVKGGLFEGTPGDPAHPGRTSFSFTSNEGMLLVLEARNHLTPDFVVGAGAWHHTASFDAIDGLSRISGNSGVYAIADGLLYAAPEGEKSGLSGWTRIGLADDRINSLDTALGSGLVYTGPFGRMSDQAGISVAYAHFGMPARREAQANGAALNAAETTIETTYSFPINAHLTLQPDLQYVIAPGGDPTRDDALVIGSRITASW